MKIQITFDSIDEMIACMRPEALPERVRKQAVRPASDVGTDSLDDLAAFAEQLAAELEPVDTPPTESLDNNDDMTESHAAVSDAPDEINEDYRIEVRRALAALNKAAGGNIAKDIVKAAAGVERLTEVPLDKLPDVMREIGARKEVA